jgi:hypothetical protein
MLGRILIQHVQEGAVADSVLFVGFGLPVRGRERQALRSFNEAVELWTRLQNQGQIESFEAVLLEPHGGDLGGFFLLRGQRDAIARVRAGEDFERLLTRAGLVVESLGVVGGSVGEGLARAIGIYEAALSELT